MEITTKFSIGDEVNFNEMLGTDREISRMGYVKSIDISVDDYGMRVEYFVEVPYNVGGIRHECYFSVLEDELR